VPNHIEFPDTATTYVGELECLAFRALVDGQPVECRVTAGLLMARFGARSEDEDALRQAFLEHGEEIQTIARDHLANGWIDEDGCLYLTTHFTRLTVTFSERLKEWPLGHERATEANNVLTTIIGPDAEEVLVKWDRGIAPTGMEGIVLHITDMADPANPISVRASLSLKEWENLNLFSLDLAGYWGSILRRRSRRLFIKSD
jgi:hypothetical protein